jgi:type I restriction enzyme S subunit
MAIRGGESADTDYLFYFVESLSSLWGQFESGGSVFSNLGRADLARIPIDLPPLDEQRAIAATLGALDDKIESNRNQQTLAQDLLRALVLRALETSGGEIGTLSTYCKLINSQVAAADLDASVNYVDLGSMPRGRIFLDHWQSGEGIASHKLQFKEGDILFGKLRPYFKKVGIAPISGVCSTDILVLRPRYPDDAGLVAVMASSDSLIEQLSSSATGTRMPRASWRDLAAWPLPILTLSERSELGRVTQPIVQRMIQLTHETNRLSKLRDVLLPELISGRIPTSEARRGLLGALS